MAWILGEEGVEERMEQATLWWIEEQLASSFHLLLPRTIQHRGPSGRNSPERCHLFP